MTAPFLSLSLLLLQLFSPSDCIFNVCSGPGYSGCDKVNVLALYIRTYLIDSENMDILRARDVLMRNETCAPICRNLTESRHAGSEDAVVGIIKEDDMTLTNDPAHVHLYYACLQEKCHPHPKIYLLSVFNQRYRNNVRFEQADFAVNETRQPIGRRAVRSPVRQYLDLDRHPCNAVKWFNNLTKVHLTPAWKDQYYCVLEKVQTSTDDVADKLEKDLGFALPFLDYAAHHMDVHTPNSLCFFHLKAQLTGYSSRLACACRTPQCVEALGQVSPVNFCPTMKFWKEATGLSSVAPVEYERILKKDHDVCVYGISPYDAFDNVILSTCHVEALQETQDYNTSFIRLQYYTRGDYSYQRACNDCTYFAAAQHYDSMAMKPVFDVILRKGHANDSHRCVHRAFNYYVYLGTTCHQFLAVQTSQEVFPLVGINVSPVVSYTLNITVHNASFTYFFDIFKDANNQFLDTITHPPELNVSDIGPTEEFSAHFGICPVSVNATTVQSRYDDKFENCATLVSYAEAEDGVKYEIKMVFFNESGSEDVYEFRKEDSSFCGYNYNKSTTVCYCSYLMDCDDPKTVMKAHFLMFGPSTLRESSIYQMNTVDDVDVFLHRV